MHRLLTDEDFNGRIIRGLFRRVPQLDFVTAAQVGLLGFEDPILLKWAAREDRTILTHDVRTMTHFAKQLILREEPMAGLIVVSQGLQIGRAIADLQLLVECRSQNEMRDRIEYLPL